MRTKKHNIKYIILGVPVLAFVSITVYLAIVSASYGAKLTHLESKIATLDLENREISGQLVQSTSLGKLSEKSSEMGFGKPEKILYVTSQAPVANRLP